MEGDGLGHLAACREHGIERAHRLLEDHADLRAAQRAHLGLRQGQQLAPLESDAAAGDLAGGRHQTHDAQRRHALAATRLADQAEDAAGLERERHPVDGPGRTGGGGKDHAEIADFEKRHHPEVAADRGSTRGVEGGANSVPSSGTLVSTWS